jgi:hypothetical protein
MVRARPELLLRRCIHNIIQRSHDDSGVAPHIRLSEALHPPGPSHGVLSW